MRNTFSVLLLFFLLPGLFGQTNDTVSLEEVSVAAIPFRKNFAESTGGVSRISLAQEPLLQVVNSEEVLNRIPGVFMAAGTNTTNRIVIRGVGSRTPYGSNRIRAYLDGIPLTSGDGITTVEDIDLTALGSMEVLKGPASALYGAGLGGVVLLNSHYPHSHGWSIEQGNEVGTYGSFSNRMLVRHKGEKSAWTAGYNRSASEGYRENNVFRRHNAFLNGHRSGKRNELNLHLHYVNLYAEIPSSLNETDFNEAPWKAAGNWLATEGFEDYQKLLGGLSLTSDISSIWKNTLVVFGKYADAYERRPFNVLDDDALSLGMRETLSREKGIWKFQSGWEVYHDFYQWETLETLEEGPGEALSKNRERRSYVNGFMFIQMRPSSRWVMDAGLNVNTTNYQLYDEFEDAVDHSGKHSYPLVLSPRLGLNYRLAETHNAYFSAGHGFSMPSLEETLLPDGQVNTDIQPEYGWNVELGSRGKCWNDRWQYDITAYMVYLENLLVTERLAEDIFTGKNAGTVLNKGLEFSSLLNIVEASAEGNFDLDMGVSLTASDNKFLNFVDDGEDHSGKYLPGIPSLIYSARLRASLSEFELHLDHRYVAKQWMDDGNTLGSDNYQLIHLQLHWKLSLSGTPIGIDISAGIKNLFDTHYASMILVNAPSFGGRAPRYYYPGLPRRFAAGIVIHWN